MKRKPLIILIVIAIAIIFIGYQYYPVADDQVVVEEVAVAVDVSKIGSEVSSGESFLLDVRTTEEIAETGLAQGAAHFDVARLEAGELPEISKDSRVYTYCKAGGRAEKAKVILEENGYTDVVNIGSLTDWIEAGGEVVTE